MATRLLLLLAAITSWGGTNAARDVCVEGFVMDKFCIDRGTLFDNPSVTTLENPERHTVHCLVDITQCLNSEFTILLRNPSGSPAYGYALRFNTVQKQEVIKLIRVDGSCSTCVNGNGGTIRQGFRGTFVGTITQEATDSQSALLSVKTMIVSPKTLDADSTSDGCPRGVDKLTADNLTLFTEAGRLETPSLAPGSNPTISTDAGSLETPSIAHGSLMIIGWGFLLPIGVASMM